MIGRFNRGCPFWGAGYRPDREVCSLDKFPTLSMSGPNLRSEKFSER